MFYSEEQYEEAINSRLATPEEAVSEFGWNAGAECPHVAWLLHDWDVWVANPHYNGPAVPHPEEAWSIDEDGVHTGVEPVAEPYKPYEPANWDDIPF